MSEEHVEHVRAMCEAFNDGDFESALAKLHPEVEWHGTVGGLDEGKVYRGHREVVSAFVESAQAWERQTLETTRFIDAGDRVIVYWHEVARGRQSGVEVETDTAVIYTMDAGSIVRVDPYMDRDQALRAAGLSD
jgi:ketosteroid isomerase-like protein